MSQKDKKDKLKELYNDIGIKFSIASARKYLRDAGYEITKKTSKREINNNLREVYEAINPELYQYTLNATFQTRYGVKKPIPRVLFTKDQPTSFTFFSRTKLKFKPFMMINLGGDLDTLKSQGLIVDLPIVEGEDESLNTLKNHQRLNALK